MPDMKMSVLAISLALPLLFCLACTPWWQGRRPVPYLDLYIGPPNPSSGPDYAASGGDSFGFQCLGYDLPSPPLGTSFEFMSHACDSSPAVYSGGKYYLPDSIVAEADSQYVYTASHRANYRLSPSHAEAAFGRCITVRCRVEYATSDDLTLVLDSHLCTGEFESFTGCPYRDQ